MARVLVIEDDEDIREWLKAILESAGHEVIAAENGSDAAERHKQQPFNVIVTDLFMPEVDGYDTIRELKNADPDLPIIAISSGGRFKSEANLKIANKLGADHTINKPIDKDELIKVVETCLKS